MDGSRSSGDLQSILDAISSSDVVENRVQLLKKLEDLDLSSKSDLISLVESLVIFWEDFTCLDTTQCLLNRTILLVAVKRVEKDSTDCLPQFLTLGVKASIWCRKHLKMTLMSIQESQEEEHSNLFFQLLLDALKFSAASFSALARYPPSEDKALMNMVENFTLEQLSLMIESVSEIQSIREFGSELLKAVQMVIGVTIKFSEFHSQALDWESSGEEFDKTSSSVNHVINVHKCIIEKLCELGTIAAKGGGGLVTVLNVSWKGVFNLLQHGNVVLSSKVNIAAIILNLVSLVIEPLKCAAVTWSSVTKETVSATDARRIFLPVKFFLINAVKISCLCPCQAYLVHKEIILCVLMISTYKVWLSSEKLLETVTEAITELLEQPSLDLVKCILNSTDLKQDLKHELMDLLFTSATERCFPDGDPTVCFKIDSMNGVFNTNCEGTNDAKTLLLGRINFLLNLMRHSFDLSDDAKLLITTKLNWLLDILVQEDVYASVLLLQVPFLYFSGKTTELKWLPLLSSLLHALKTFMVAVSKNHAWLELQSFLLDNFLHPHFLCWDIVMELWCFMLRYADNGLVNGVISNLFSVMKLLASSEPVLVYSSALRKMARSITMLLTYGAQTKLNEIYESIFIQDKSQLSTVIWVALILEGFPLNLLSEKMKNIAIQSMTRDYWSFIENFNETSMLASSSVTIGLPVFSASTTIQSMKLSTSDIDVRTLKFLLALLRSYKISGVEQAKGICRKLISETLGIISCMKHLYAANEMEEVILELEKLFISGPTASDALLYECKSGLAPFLAGLAHIKMTETDDNAKSCAVWELYHMLFKERHWAFIHLGLTAFGYFAARTSCDELWRFVPQNAALSYDLESGKQLNEEGFMLEFKIFLEKEMALLTVTPSSEQLALLMKEGLVLKDMLNTSLKLCGTGNKCKSMEIDEGPSSRKRKLPEGISKGMELLKNGLKVMRQGLSLLEESHFGSRELHNKLRSHFSGLEDEIFRLGSQGGVD